MGVSDNGNYTIKWSIEYGKGAKDTGSFTGSETATAPTHDDAHKNLIDKINSAIAPQLSDIKKSYLVKYSPNVGEVVYTITLNSEAFSTT